MEKEPKKVRLLAIFIIIFVGVIIMVMGYAIFKFYTDRDNALKEASDLNQKIVALENDKTNLETEVKKLKENKTTTEANNKTENNSKTNYSYSDIAGSYKYEGTSEYDSEELYLYDNGTFEVSNNGGFAGNYIIVNDTIILNKLIQISTGTDTWPASGEIKIKISNGNLVTDDVKSFYHINSKESVTFIKVTNPDGHIYNNKALNQFIEHPHNLLNNPIY